MKDKNKIILLALTSVLALAALFLKTNLKENDAIKFKKEYETLNNKTNSQKKIYPTVKIEKDNKIKYATYEEIKEILTKKSGIIYFGFPECPWCRNIVPLLLEAAQQENIDTIYYYNAYAIRDKKHLDENKNIIIYNEGTKEYQELIEIMKDYLTPYEGLENDTIKRLYFPTVVFVKDGKIKDIHIGTIQEQKDPYTPLTKEQQETIISTYKKGIQKTQNQVCTDKC